MKISRRNLLQYAAAMGLSAALFRVFEANAALTDPIRVRQNIAAFSMDKGKVAAFRAGVGQMKRSRTNRHDPQGWDYWAAVHGTDVTTPQDPTDPNGNLLYSQCKHSDSFQSEPHFLSWHRPYLYFFELMLKQAAIDAGETSQFELPYWDWYTNAAIPRIFVEEDANSNPLWHSKARVDLTGVNLRKDAFQNASMIWDTNTSPQQSFSLPFELNPHGTVHDNLGDDMGDITTSARDPIFWLHHANIDRLWTAWMKSGQKTIPSATSDWGNASWIYDPQASRRNPPERYSIQKLRCAISMTMRRCRKP
jgi:tyrosinase